MKRLKQLAKELNIDCELIQRTVAKLGFKPKKLNDKRIILLDEHQENRVIQVLYLERKVTEIIFESKMNKPEEQEPFEEFKKRIYGKT